MLVGSKGKQREYTYAAACRQLEQLQSPENAGVGTKYT